MKFSAAAVSKQPVLPGRQPRAQRHREILLDDELRDFPVKLVVAPQDDPHVVAADFMVRHEVEHSCIKVERTEQVQGDTGAKTLRTPAAVSLVSRRLKSGADVEVPIGQGELPNAGRLLDPGIFSSRGNRLECLGRQCRKQDGLGRTHGIQFPDASFHTNFRRRADIVR